MRDWKNISARDAFGYESSKAILSVLSSRKDRGMDFGIEQYALYYMLTEISESLKLLTEWIPQRLDNIEQTISCNNPTNLAKEILKVSSDDMGETNAILERLCDIIENRDNTIDKK